MDEEEAMGVMWTLVKPLTLFPRAFSQRDWLLKAWMGALFTGQNLAGQLDSARGGEWSQNQLVASCKQV